MAENQKKTGTRAAVSCKKVRERMESLGIYKPEFDDTIKRYCMMRKEYDTISKSYASGGYVCTITGATGPKKNPVVTTLESLRKDLLAAETALGLTPGGLFRLNDRAFEQPKKSKLNEVLGGLPADLEKR